MDTGMGQRLAGAAGLIGFTLLMVGATLDGEFATPPSDDASATAGHFAATSADAAFVAGLTLEALGLLLLLGLLSEVAHLVAGGHDAARWLGSVALASAVVATTLTLLAVAAFGAATFRAGHGGVGGEGLVVLSDLRHVVSWVSLPVWAAVYLSAGAGMVRGGAFPSWFGWVALGVGALHLAVPFLSPSLWDLATGLGGLWMVAAAALLLFRPPRPSLTAHPTSMGAGR